MSAVCVVWYSWGWPGVVQCSSAFLRQNVHFRTSHQATTEEGEAQIPGDTRHMELVTVNWLILRLENFHIFAPHLNSHFRGA